jgi:chromosome segregation ATPase
MNDREKIERLCERVEELKIELDSASQIKKSEVMLNASFKETIKKQEITIDELRKVIDRLLSQVVRLRNKIKELVKLD